MGLASLAGPLLVIGSKIRAVLAYNKVGMNNAAIIRVPKSELVDVLNIPDDFDVRDIMMEFYSDTILIKVTSPNLDEVCEGNAYPHIDIRSLY